jgi:hypothetical protein
MNIFFKIKKNIKIDPTEESTLIKRGIRYPRLNPVKGERINGQSTLEDGEEFSCRLTP